MSAPLELWAGPECTVNRVHDRFQDQLERTGFADRLGDIDRIAGLGARCVRFPALWERMSADHPTDADWRWIDQRLARLAECRVAPIVGLVHHGSGPRHTSLVDTSFPTGLARYALRLAERHPQIESWTPVNEPLTTARFSGLYGLWYPHGTRDALFVRALLQQVHGIRLVMRAVRTVNPRARLVQTDDLGFTTAADPTLAYQAAFENERRWLCFDLLRGRVTREHRLWRYLIRHGATADELAELADDPCPPDIVGINAYVTSERFIDPRLDRYPAHLHGGNGRHRYADIETARVQGEPIGGVGARLREAWARYGSPMAVTEVHMGCTREEQMRWLRESWAAAEQARADGCDVRAVTAWATFGTFDWNSLLTRDIGHYEPGLWDVRSDPPRPTALVALASQLARGAAPDHPVLAGPGWWERGVRLVHEPHGELRARPMRGRPIVVTGATGTLGRAFARLCELRGLPCRTTLRREMDVTDPMSIGETLDRHQPWAVINTAGFVRVDDAEHDAANHRANAEGAASLAAACARRGIRFVSFSSDLVFDGRKCTPYVESDEARPLNAYGASKLDAENSALGCSPDALMIRTAAFFGPWDAHNFATRGLDALARGERWGAAGDQVVSPTYVPDLVQATLDLLIDGERGVWHLANAGAVSWADFARRITRAAGYDADRIDDLATPELHQGARRPRFSALDSERGRIMPPLDDAIARYFVDRGLEQEPFRVPARPEPTPRRVELVVELEMATDRA